MHRVIHRKQVFFIKKTWIFDVFYSIVLFFTLVMHSLWISIVYNCNFMHTTTSSKNPVKTVTHVCK